MAADPVIRTTPRPGCAALGFGPGPLDAAACAAGAALAAGLAEEEGLVAVLLQGAGDATPGPWPAPPERPDRDTLAAVRDLVEAVAALPVPVVAALHGEVSGEGLELALAADLRLATDATTFAMPQLVQGRLPGCGGSQRLPRLVGPAGAFELLLGGTWDAARAEALGLVNGVVAPEALAAEAAGWLTALADRAPVAMRFLKEVVRRGADVPLDQALLIEEDAYLLLQTSEDRTEGIRAFLEKRRPRFRGR